MAGALLSTFLIWQVGRLAEGDPQLRAELGKAGAISPLCSHLSVHSSLFTALCSHLSQAGAISPLVRMLKHGNSEEREQAALAIGSAPSSYGRLSTFLMWQALCRAPS